MLLARRGVRIVGYISLHISHTCTRKHAYAVGSLAHFEAVAAEHSKRSELVRSTADAVWGGLGGPQHPLVLERVGGIVARLILAQRPGGIVALAGGIVARLILAQSS